MSAEPSATRALLIVDVQSGFMTHATEHVLGKVDALQAQYEHIYASVFINPPESPFRRLLGWHRLSAGSRETELAFQPVERAVVFRKSTYTGIGELLLGELREKSVEEVALCGIDTDGCVLKCALDLFEAGIRPVVLASACASSGGAEYHEAALLILARTVGTRQIAD